MIPTDIEAYVFQNFSSNEALPALELLSHAVTHTGAEAEPRLMRCAVIASGNTLFGLQVQVEELKHDYRDVIIAAEYKQQNGDWIQVVDLNNPIGQNA